MQPPATGASTTEAWRQAMCDAVAAAARAVPVARLLGATLAGVPPIEKSDGSPVTAADYILQAIVVASLRERSRDGRVPLIGEEHADALLASRRPDVERLVVDAVRAVLGWRDRAAALACIDGDAPRAGEPAWTIDPIDGTKGFILHSQFSICLALIDGPAPVAAALACPRMARAGDLELHPEGPGVILGASLGGGTFEWDGAGRDARPVRCPAWTGGTLRWARSMNRSGSVGPGRVEPVLRALVPALVDSRMDSQCKYALAARGDADLVVRMPRGDGQVECIWDHAPGVLLVTEAGGIATDVRGAPLDFGRGETLDANAGVLCAAAGLHERIVEALAPLVAGAGR
ncbi:MAG: inositol monophosphatase family protein [Phycisphaerales bacterium]